MQRKAIVRDRAVVLMAAAVLVVPLFFSCEMFRMDEAEFSAALLKSVTDKGYVEEQAKGAYDFLVVHVEEGLTIELDLTVGLKLKATFTSFPYYDSTITGTLWADLSIETDGEDDLLSVTLTFTTDDPHLEVTGKHAGTYAFEDASITYDFTTQTYSYAGTVVVDDTSYDLANDL